MATPFGLRDKLRELAQFPPYVYHQPHLYNLAKIYDKHRAYAAVIADTNSARIIVFGLGRTLGAETITNVRVRSRSWVEGWWLRRAQSGAYQSGAQVKVIEDPALLAEAGGVCAALRFRL